MAKERLKRQGILYPELSYKIVGILFSVFNELGYGYKEKYYQMAIAEEFKESGLKFIEQVRHKLAYKQKILGVHIFDFLIEDKIILEIKQGDHFSKNDIKQTVSYLKNSELKLGILVRFTRRGLKFKRIINIW